MPNLKDFRILSPTLVSFSLSKVEVLLNKPFYVGFSIVDLSRIGLYKFHYDFMKKLYPGDSSQLLMTDTDSLLYEIKTNNLYSDIASYSYLFDFSNYPIDHPLFSSANKAILGKFKDEAGGKAISKFIGLRSKMYTYEICDSSSSSTTTVCKAKGFSKSAINSSISLNDYLLSHSVSKNLSVSMNFLRSFEHTIFTCTQSKFGLSGADTKRYICSDNVHTLAYGHWRTGNRKRPSDCLPPDNTRYITNAKRSLILDHCS